MGKDELANSILELLKNSGLSPADQTEVLQTCIDSVNVEATRQPDPPADETEGVDESEVTASS